MKNIFQYRLTSAIKYLWLPFLIGIIFISCKDEDAEIWPENPYIMKGLKHNELLDNFESEYGEEFGQIQNTLEAEEFILDKMFGDNIEQGFIELSEAKTLLGLGMDEALSSYDFTNTSVLCNLFNSSSTIKNIMCPTLETLVLLDGNEQNEQIHSVIREAEIDLMKTSQDEELHASAMFFLAITAASADRNKAFKSSDKPKWWKVVLSDGAGAALGFIGGGAASVPLAATFSGAVLRTD
ncbi:MAG: hypothetical protein AAGA77_01600 [Bacteroidota bacterium]